MVASGSAQEEEGAGIINWEVSCPDDRDILFLTGRTQEVGKRNFLGRKVTESTSLEGDLM